MMHVYRKFHHNLVYAMVLLNHTMVCTEQTSQGHRKWCDHGHTTFSVTMVVTHNVQPIFSSHLIVLFTLHLGLQSREHVVCEPHKNSIL